MPSLASVISSSEWGISDVETLGGLYRHGLSNEQLLFDCWAVDLVWDSIKGIPLGCKQRFGDPQIYEDFEAKAEAEKR